MYATYMLFKNNSFTLIFSSTSHPHSLDHALLHALTGLLGEFRYSHYKLIYTIIASPYLP